MTVCHDPKRQQTYYTKYSLTPANIAAQRAIKRPSFIQSDFFPGMDINLLYSRKHQRTIIPKLIMGDEMLSDDDPTIFLSRGRRTFIISLINSPAFNAYRLIEIRCRPSRSQSWFHLWKRTKGYFLLYKCYATGMIIIFHVFLYDLMYFSTPSGKHSTA